ncbi:isocitrate dehydrogenase [NAD] subunit gamma, mitochondrial-like isoform X2 [Sitophilus oryzae]|uniref:Isocitrate dehydrogenase [NAD] subunit gamma, mitochondrial-like isoform X2 n=1 Tax=Sitophilus oryzae TaxID=7048 RepID=A0A6J2YPW0_SITOR|nr:isocitrate dehydrogenase [NAD] subunit gamma, mitochondrial-like isoform X2 [Sitophilus oryzae]
MVLKVVRIFGNRCFLRSVHYTVLPADTYEGKVITKAKVMNKLKNREPSQYGGRNVVTMMPGVDPGPILMSYVKDIYKRARVPVDFEEILYSGTGDEAKAAEFGETAVISMHRNGVGIKGNFATPHIVNNPNIAIRTHLDLFVNIIHVKSFQNIKCKYSNLDMYICRQNTEGEYAMLEHEARPGVVESLKIITRENTERFAEFCFNFAIKKNRKKVTIVHKANIMKLADGLFVKVIKDVAKNYPDINVTDMIVDNCTMQMVQNPSQFDMILTPNLYGNILSNIATGLIGGPGLLSGRNYGSSCALFEVGSRHLTFGGSYINPIAMLKASIDLLRYLDKDEYADLIDTAITKTLSEDKIQTKDIGGTNSTEEVLDQIKVNITKLLKTAKIKQF